MAVRHDGRRPPVRRCDAPGSRVPRRPRTPGGRLMSARDLEGEIRELRARIATLVDEATNNERLLKRSPERELELLKAENLAQTFDAICGGLKESYVLESVTLLLLDPQHEIRHLLIADHLKVEDFPNVLFTDSLNGLAPQFNSLQPPGLGP